MIRFIEWWLGMGTIYLLWEIIFNNLFKDMKEDPDLQRIYGFLDKELANVIITCITLVYAYFGWPYFIIKKIIRSIIQMFKKD